MKKKILLSSLFFIFGLNCAFANWHLNDVSYLFDLPRIDEENFLLRADSQKDLGPLFPKELSSPIQDLVISFDAPKDSYQALRVMGMRIDPCFKFSSHLLAACTPQIRLIWQPIKREKELVTTYDAAVHTFYNLTQAEFKDLLKKLKALKNKFHIVTTGRALSVHPAFKSHKTRKVFNDELKKIILETAGEKNLVRFTFMKFLTINIWWSFGGMDKDSYGRWNPTAIANNHSPEHKQDFFNDAFNESVGMRGTLIPTLERSFDNLSDSITGFGISENAEGTKKIQAAINTIDRIENPKFYNSETLDCVHCHIAEPTRVWLEKKFPKIVEETKHPFIYAQDFLQGYNLKNITLDKNFNKSLRAFGYMGNKPSINQRVINESATVARELNLLAL